MSKPELSLLGDGIKNEWSRQMLDQEKTRGQQGEGNLEISGVNRKNTGAERRNTEAGDQVTPPNTQPLVKCANHQTEKSSHRKRMSISKLNIIC